MADHKLSFTDFAKVSAEEWENKIALDLKGASSEELGLPLGSGQFMPIAIHSAANVTAGNIHHFAQFPLITTKPSPQENPNILAGLLGGVNALIIEQPSEGKMDWSDLLDQVDLSFLDITLAGDRAFQQSFFDYLQDTKKKTRSGENRTGSLEDELALYQQNQANHPNWRFFSCQVRSKANKPAKLIADFLTLANTRLERLETAGLLQAGANSFSCRLTIDTNYLQTIMNIRAIRLVWALLLDAWKLDSQQPIFIQAESDEQIFADGDIEKTMIRSTSLAAAALVGGANGIWIKPMFKGEAKVDFYQRIARNNLHLFEQEGKLGWVNDPVAGAKYFEHGANEIAEQGWDLFRNG